MLRLLPILVCMIIINGWAQSLSSYENRKSIRTNNEFITFHVAEHKKNLHKKKYNDRKDYFWYKSQEVKSTQGGSAGLLLHGLYERFYTNKQIAARGTFYKGLKNGKWTYWNESGRIIGFEKYRKGKLIHKEKKDPETGKSILIVDRGCNKLVYKSDKEIVITNYDSTKVVVSKLNEKGEVYKKERYLFGELHGRQWVISQEGKIKQQYKNNVLIERSKLLERSNDTINAKVTEQPDDLDESKIKTTKADEENTAKKSEDRKSEGKIFRRRKKVYEPEPIIEQKE